MNFSLIWIFFSASRIIQLLVKEGQQVEIGTPLCIVESMKTEIVLRAGREGVVAKVFGNIGDFVPEGRVIVEFEE